MRGFHAGRKFEGKLAGDRFFATRTSSKKPSAQINSTAYELLEVVTEILLEGAKNLAAPFVTALALHQTSSAPSCSMSKRLSL